MMALASLGAVYLAHGRPRAVNPLPRVLRSWRCLQVIDFGLEPHDLLLQFLHLVVNLAHTPANRGAY